jgi:hypothetical protein
VVREGERERERETDRERENHDEDVNKIIGLLIWDMDLFREVLLKGKKAQYH